MKKNRMKQLAVVLAALVLCALGVQEGKAAEYDIPTKTDNIGIELKNGDVLVISATPSEWTKNGQPITGGGAFPIKILEDDVTCTIKGPYTGDLANDTVQRKTPTGIIDTKLNGSAYRHGIFVGNGLKNVTVILDGVAIQTSDTYTGTLHTNTATAANRGHAAFLIYGYPSATNSSAANDAQALAGGSNVVVRLAPESNNYLFSGKGYVNSVRAGLEVWKGSTVYIEGEGTLVARSGNSRRYTASEGSGATFLGISSEKGSPYGIYSVEAEKTGETHAAGDGYAAGIGQGGVYGSGGNVVIRGNPTVHAIGGGHGAGIGGGWSSSGPAKACGYYQGDVLVYGGKVFSWGGQHGAGIGGGCGNSASLGNSVVVLPTADVHAVSYSNSTNYKDLGAVENVVYFNDAKFPKLAIYTADFRETMMYLDLSKNPAVLDVIRRIGGGLNPARLALGETRKYSVTDLTEWNMNTIATDKYVLLLTGSFTPKGGPVAFFTEAKTEKNFSYQPIAATIQNTTNEHQGLVTPTDDYNNGNNGAPRFVMIAPEYNPKVGLTPNTNLYSGYDNTGAESSKITLRIENAGNQRLYNPVIILEGNDFFKVGGNESTLLQDEANAMLTGIVQTDATTGTPYIPTQTENASKYYFELDIRIKSGRNPGKYDGWILFSADNLPSDPDPQKFTVEVLRKRLPPPKVKVILPVENASTISEGQSITVRVDFENQGATPVKNFTKDHIFVQNGDVTADPVYDNSTEVSPVTQSGYYSGWTYVVTPTTGLISGSLIATYVKLDAALDTLNEKTDGVSETLYLTYNEETPFANFSVADGRTLSYLKSLIITFSGNSKDPNHSDDVYLGAAGMLTGTKFTTNPAATATALAITVTDQDGTTLVAGTDYDFTVTDDNTVEISKAGGGFPNGTYTLTLPAANSVYNYEGNRMEAKTVTFTIQKPEIDQVSIDPATFSYEGGTITITITGKYLNKAGQNLKIQYPSISGDPNSGLAVPIPPENVTEDGTQATYTIEIPPNQTATAITYAFQVKLIGRVDDQGNLAEDVGSPLIITVGAAKPTIDTSRGHGLFADPRDQSTAGGPVSLTVKGENLCLFQNLTIRVVRDESANWTPIPVPTTPEFGERTITLTNAYWTEENLSSKEVKYAFTLWHYESGADVQVPDAATSAPPITDTTLVRATKPAVYDLKLTTDLEYANPSQSVRMSSAGGEVYFVVDGINMDELELTLLNNATGDPILIDSYFERTGDHNEKASTTIALVIPPNMEKGDVEHVFRIFPGDYTVTVTQTQEGERIMRTIRFPAVEGATVSIPPGDFHIESREDLIFTVYPSEENLGKTLVVTTDRVLPEGSQDVYIARLEDGSFQVRIPRIQSTIQLSIEFMSGGDDGSSTSFVDDFEHSIWSDRGRIHILSHHGGTANIYNASGRLVKVASLSSGETVVTLPPGLYLIETDCGGKFKTVVR